MEFQVDKYTMRRDVYFMKMLLKIMVLIASLALAVNYVMPSMDGRTKRKLRKKAKKFQHRAEDMFNKAMVPLR